jgi:sarcosine oxidase subunit beta
MSQISGTEAVDGRIVIVGAGIIGLSIASHLLDAGHSDVLVLDRGAIGEGTTARATGGIRQQFSSTINAQLAHASVRYYAHMGDLLGEPFDFRQHGYLMVTGSEQTLGAARTSVGHQRALGIPSEVIDVDRIRDLNPAVAVDGLVGATYCGTDGSGSPMDAAQAFARHIRRAGGAIRQHTPVVAVDRDSDGRVTGVRTPDEAIEGTVVIDAAGPWALQVAQLVGAAIPLIPTPRQAIHVAPARWMNVAHPFTVDLDSGAYLHPERHGAVLGGTDRDRTPGMDAVVDQALIGRLLELAVPRFPGLATAGLGRSWCGLREMTPDDHALVGPIADTPGFWVVAGFSGHGFMQAPAIGQEVASWLLRGATEFDLTPLRPGRFTDGRAVEERVVF